MHVCIYEHERVIVAYEVLLREDRGHGERREELLYRKWGERGEGMYAVNNMQQ